jgi:hypothetical protein
VTVLLRIDGCRGLLQNFAFTSKKYTCIRPARLPGFCCRHAISRRLDQTLMKFATARPYADPEAAARKLIEIANSVEAVQDGRIHIELINAPMLFEHKATPGEYSAGLKFAIDRG